MRRGSSAPWALLGGGLAVCLLLLIGLHGSAQAAPMTFDFTGTITAFPTVPPDPFGGTICDGSNCNPASTFIGSYTFDSGATNSIASVTQGSYQQGGVPYGLTVTIGGNIFDTNDSLAINTQHTAGFFDFYGVLACTNSLSPPGCAAPVSTDDDLSISLSFNDPTGTALGSNALPLTPPSLGAFASNSFMLLTQVNGDAVELDGTITSLTCAAGCASVPEPASWLLLAVGIGGAALLRRLCCSAVNER